MLRSGALLGCGPAVVSGVRSVGAHGGRSTSNSTSNRLSGEDDSSEAAGTFRSSIPRLSSGRPSHHGALHEPLLSDFRHSDIEMISDVSVRSNSGRGDAGRVSLTHGDNAVTAEEFDNASMSLDSLEHFRHTANDLERFFLDAVRAVGYQQQEGECDVNELSDWSGNSQSGELESDDTSYRQSTHHTVISSECERIPKPGNVDGSVSDDTSYRQRSYHTVVSSTCERMERPLTRGMSILDDAPLVDGTDEQTASHRRTPGVSLFLSKSGNTSSQDEIQKLSTAIRNNDFKVVHQILNRSGVNLSQSAVLIIACESCNYVMVEQLLLRAEIDVNWTIERDFTALYVACQKGDAQVVRLLLDHEQIDVNKPTADGCTALYVSAYNGHMRVVSLLLQREDIDVNHATKQGRTALVAALKKQHFEIAMAIIDHPTCRATPMQKRVVIDSASRAYNTKKSIPLVTTPFSERLDSSSDSPRPSSDRLDQIVKQPDELQVDILVNDLIVEDEKKRFELTRKKGICFAVSLILVSIGLTIGLLSNELFGTPAVAPPAPSFSPTPAPPTYSPTPTPPTYSPTAEPTPSPTNPLPPPPFSCSEGGAISPASEVFDCEVVNGNVAISGAWGPFDFDLSHHLPNVCAINGNLVVQDVWNLVSFEMSQSSCGGVTIAGHTHVVDNEELVAFNLSAVNIADDYFRINNNNVLKVATVSGVESIDNYLGFLDNPALETVSFPVLQTIGGNFFMNRHEGGWPDLDGRLQEVSFPKLTSIGGYFSFDHTFSLALRMPVLNAVGGMLSFGRSRLSANFPALEFVGGQLSLRNNWAGDETNFPLLHTIGFYLRISDNWELTSLSLPSLRSIGDMVIIGDNKRLESISMPFMDTINGLCAIENQPSLIDIGLELVTQCTFVDVCNNDLCFRSFNGLCEDGGPGSVPVSGDPCNLGTDCFDCCIDPHPDRLGC